MTPVQGVCLLVGIVVGIILPPTVTEVTIALAVGYIAVLAFHGWREKRKK
jgi:hypothetical protein